MKQYKEEGSASNKAVVAFLASTGVLGVVAAGMLSVASDARIAIQVAEQHGQELLMIRGEISSLRQEIVARTQNRFTRQDGVYLAKELERLEMDINKHLESREHE